MILVAFVLVLFATVMLIIGTFFDASTAYIWISIGACLATFVVLGISYLSRRRGQDDEAARPEPLAADASRSAPAPRSSTVGGTATMVRDQTTTEADDTDDTDDGEESSVTIVPSRAPAPVGDGPDETPATIPVADAEAGDEAGDEETADEEAPAAAAADDQAPAAAPVATPAPRRVAPRRVVRRAAPATGAAADGVDDASSVDRDAVQDTPDPSQPRIVATSPRPTTPPPTTPTPAADEPAAATSSDATPTPTRKVVRRVTTTGGQGTRRVVRRTASSGGTRKVVRRTAGADTPPRTVRRVVRATSGDTAPAEQPKTAAPSSGRTGTRGKRARAVLSEIKGVGPAKQDALLKKFGSLEQMADASVEDIAEIKGVGESVATEIKRTLQAR